MLTSWGRQPGHIQCPHNISWRSELTGTAESLHQQYGTTLPFGMGRSYGDSCLAMSDNVLHMAGLNRFISFEPDTGILVAESGVTLEQILSVSIPLGWFLPVTPGTKYVSLGGAVANDVHGKNHHVRGTFGRYIRKFTLLRSDNGLLTCSANENTRLYRATIGGLGLTGIIETIELQLIPITSNMIDVTTIRFNSLHEFFQLSNEFDRNYEYSVAWIDCLAKGKKTGRGVYMVGNHSYIGELSVSSGKKLAVPCTFPVSVINRATLPLLNALYFAAHKSGKQHSQVCYDSYFYPLDRIRNWNRAYGPAGFQQYQCVIPDTEAGSAMQALLSAIASSGCGSFLAVMKRCGPIKSPGLLSFPMQGLSLALDFPQKDELGHLFAHFDSIVRDAGGRLYPAKDAHMSGSDFRAAYPNWSKVEDLRDPVLLSRFWKRVTNL